MCRHISLIGKIASVYVFIEGSNDKVSIPEIASFGIRNLLWFLVRSEYASYFWALRQYM